MTTARIVKLGLVQMSMTDNKEENLKKAIVMTEEAAKKGANIVVLPELFTGPYFCIVEKDATAFNLAETIPGETTKALSVLAARLKIVLVGGSIFEKDSKGKFFNTACVFGPDGEMIGSYRKTHIPHDPGFYEQDYFAQGDTGYRVHSTPFGKIAVFICYDQWYPEAARIAALQGAEIIVYPTAIGNPHLPPVDPTIPEDFETMWRSVQVGHAAANNVYVAGVNRVGNEGNTTFWGGSFIASPTAAILAKGDDKECILLADCDLSYVHKMHDAWRLLLERQPKTYGALLAE